MWNCFKLQEDKCKTYEWSLHSTSVSKSGSSAEDFNMLALTLHVVTLLFLVFTVKYLLTKDILSEPNVKLLLHYHSCRLSQVTMQRDHGPAQIKNCIWISVMDKHCMSCVLGKYYISIGHDIYVWIGSVSSRVVSHFISKMAVPKQYK